LSFQAFQSIFTGSLISAYAALFTALGLAIWWVVRKRLKDFWLPIVRILDFPVSRLPRIVLKKPPLIPFLAFLLASIAVAIWTNKPRLKIFSDFEPGMSQVHVYVDMSPSVSAQIPLNELGQKLVSLLEQVGSRSRVTFGTSHGPDVYEMTSPAAAADLISGLGFHRGGGKIGPGVRAQISRIGEVDQLFVLSDRDQHSWGGFQWQYLLVDSDIRHVDIDSTASRPNLPNVFVQDARFTSSPGSLTMDWEIEIAEGALVRPASGSVNASLAGNSLATANWEIPAGRRSALVSVSWPSTLVPRDSVSEPIEWNIEVSGGDAMTIDNKFRSPVLGRRDRVVVIGEPTGELRLEDALMPLETALQVSGFEVERFDRWPSKVKNQLPDVVASARFLAVLAGDGSSVDMWCPVVSEKLMPVWLIPDSGSASFAALCRCIAKFSVGITNDMCTDRLTREQWIATLVNVGAKQIGGDVGFANQAVAMRLVEEKRGVDFTILTVPLRPQAQYGITWGSFPVLVRQLSAFTTGQVSGGSVDAEGLRGLWPRVPDVSSVLTSADAASRTQILRETNIPVGESMLAYMATGDLPPSWTSAGSGGRVHSPSKRDSEDPFPWIRILVGCVFLAFVVEAFWLWRRERSKRAAASIFVFIAMSLFVHSESSSAQVRIEWLGQKPSSVFQFQTLAREVSSRTSLEFSHQAEYLSNFDDASAQLPWLWTSTPGGLAGKDGKVSSLGRLWLKRGGILIIDGTQSEKNLETMFEPLMQGTVRPSGWMVMPPDHEFMRSFYLLNSLPTCKGHPWKIFSFDGRVVAISSPYSLLASLQDQPAKWSCESNVTYEQQVRIFVNLLMMAFTTDYKRDQIHLPEILKRLRVP
jgi:hypothetical protein